MAAPAGTAGRGPRAFQGVSRVLSADIPSLNGKPAQFFELYKEAYLKEQRSTAGDYLRSITG